jgi:hypothetical protein
MSDSNIDQIREQVLREIAISFWLVQCHPQKEKIYNIIWDMSKKK